MREILLASLTFPKMINFLSPFQFFRKSLNLTPVEMVMERLNFTSSNTTTVEEDDTTYEVPF